MLTIPILKILYYAAYDFDVANYIKEITNYMNLIQLKSLSEKDKRELTNYALEEVNKKFETNFKCEKEDNMIKKLYEVELFLKNLVNQSNNKVCESAIEEMINRISYNNGNNS